METAALGTQGLSLRSWSFSFSSLALALARRSLSWETIATGARPTNFGLERLAFALAISPSRREISFCKRARSATGSISTCNIKRYCPDTATGDSESGRSSTIFNSDWRTRAENALVVAELGLPVMEKDEEILYWDCVLRSLRRFRAALTTPLAIAISRSAASSIFSGWHLG